MTNDNITAVIQRDIRVLGATIGVSQAEIARKIGVSPSILNRKLINGSLRADDLYNIADALGYDIVFKKRDNQ